MKNAIVNIFSRLFIFTFSVILTFLILEFGAWLLMNIILKQGRLFETDEILGWRHIPNLSQIRKNSDGEFWQITTNQYGYRSALNFNEKSDKRILIVGDSFAFGEGVNEEDRFDNFLLKEEPDWSIVNLGTMGYGTDQELIAAKKYYPYLRKDDALLIVSFINDFHDVLIQRHSSRLKPYFNYDKEGNLVENLPIIGLAELLRDKSYIVAKILNVLMPNEDFSEKDLKKGIELYKNIVFKETEAIRKRKVKVIIAYYGGIASGIVSSENTLKDINGMFNELCGINNLSCLKLDNSFIDSSKQLLLKDYHWNKNGHMIVGENIIDYLRKIL